MGHQWELLGINYSTGNTFSEIQNSFGSVYLRELEDDIEGTEKIIELNYSR